MTEIAAIAASTAQSAAPRTQPTLSASVEAPNNAFAQMLRDGVAGVEHRVDHADQMVRAFTLDDSVPIHQVTIALEEARISVELAMQVRQRLVDGLREIMNTQL